MTASDPIWNGDLAPGDLSQWGAWEYKGTFAGTPALSERVTVAPSVDGYLPPHGVKNLMRLTVQPGDQYGGSTGWRTLARQYEPLRPITAGYDSTFAFALLLPPGYPGKDTNLWIAGPEIHHASGVGTAPYGFRAYSPADGFEVSVKGGDSANPSYGIDHFDFGKGYTPGRWQIFVQRYRHGVSDGAYGLWYCEEGGQLAQVVVKDPCPTMYAGLTNYLLAGIYRDQVGTDPTTIYTAGWREYATVADASAWARQMAGAVSPPPPPPPPPPDRFAAARAKVNLFRKSSPNIAAAFDETFKALGQ